MNFRLLLTTLAVVFASVLFASVILAQQDLSKRQLEHADYDRWNTIAGTGISRDGKWAMFVVQNGAIDGEATVTFRGLKSGKEYDIPRGSAPMMTWDSKFALYRITPSKKKVKQLRKAKTKSSDMPKAKFQILELATGELITLEDVKTFRAPSESGEWVACLMEKSDDSAKLDAKKSAVKESYEVTESGLRRPRKPLKLKKRELESKPTEPKEKSEKKPEAESKMKEEVSENSDDEKNEDKKKKTKQVGTALVLINLKNGLQRTFPDVVSFSFSKHGEKLAFSTSVASEKPTTDKETASKTEKGDAEPSDGVVVIDLESMKSLMIASGHGNYRNFAFNEDGSQLAFITDKDDYEAESSSWSLYHWKSGSKQSKKIAFEGADGIDDGWWVSPNSSQSFAENGKRLYFETAPVPESVLKEREKVKEQDEEVAKLDIWHWQDPQLQPQQLIQAQRERSRDYRAAWNLKKKNIVQLATKEIPDISIDLRRDSNLAIASTNMPYQKMMSWDIPGYLDAWLVNLDTGEREQLLERVRWFPSMSPEGKYLTWFDSEQKKWFAMQTKGDNREPKCISEGIKYPLYNELHDTPSLPRAYGSAGWLDGDEGFLIYDRYDIWKLDPSGKEPPACLTGGKGRDTEVRFRYLRLDRELRSIDPEAEMFLDGFDMKTKASGFWKLGSSGKGAKDGAEPSSLIMLEESFGRLTKAAESDDVLFTRSTFDMCPDLWHSDLKFKKIHRLSDINPQQEEYLWGSAELVHWNSANEEKLDGILIKPEGFDPNKKYPMMVYFYERNSDNLHRYYSPEAGRSIINFSFYASRGYLVFIPDIPYTTGEPGQSAADSILPGVQSLVEQGFVDQNKIGMQGHSWGGYQTAYLVTQTDMFACAESGAPVSNMTSAYGGIRWGSGMSRMFQYERTQSRIGEDLWAAREKYIRNSPVFFADRINTPILILHNDEDGAVPWYQGIELFVALRRLEKPAWMLNYNGNPHWVMGDVNRRDFATRMQQFFDHYLMDAPEPEWMAVGVPAVKKGKELGLELLEPIESEEKAESKNVSQ